MPIRLATIGRQRTIAGIAKAVFDVSSGAALEQAQAALIRANPHLADESAIRPGERIIVPAIPALRPHPAAAAGDALPEPLLDLARERFAALEKMAGDPLEKIVAAAKEAAQETRSKDRIDAILKSRPDLREQIGAIQQGAEAELERVIAATGALRDAVERLKADLSGAAPT